MTTTSTRYITRLRDIPNFRAYLEKEMWPVLDSAGKLIRPTRSVGLGTESETTTPFGLASMAVGVFDAPTSGQCYRRDLCPLDFDGSHARDIMTPLLVAKYIGKDSTRPTVDGLAPETIRFVKAHTSLRTRLSNRELNAQANYPLARAGDARSYGAVFTKLWAPGSYLPVLEFIVATSGDKPYKDHQLSEALSGRIVAALVEDSLIPDFVLASDTFILREDLPVP